MNSEREDDALTYVHEDIEVVHADETRVAALVKSEVEAQLDAAHRYPRDLNHFVAKARRYASHNKEVAAACIYSLPRKENGKVKMIVGPSIRLAEICAMSWGNLHIARRVLDHDDKYVYAQGLAWDLEANIKWAVEVKRKITGKEGRLFTEDMITVTGNATASIAARNAIFSAIPRAYVLDIFDLARKTSVGEAKAFTARRDEILDRLTKLGVPKERILAAIECTGVESVTQPHLETLIGLGTAIKDGNLSIDEAFPEEPRSGGGRGVLDINSFRAGAERNRGHGEEDIAQDPKLTQQLQASIEQQHGRCDIADFVDIENAAKEASVRLNDVTDHVTATMGFAEYSMLTKARKAEVLKWIEAKKKR